MDNIHERLHVVAPTSNEELTSGKQKSNTKIKKVHTLS